MISEICYFFDFAFRLVCDYDCHRSRKPPSNSPGEDWGTGVGTAIWQIFNLIGIINSWIDLVGGNIVSITYNDMKVYHDGVTYNGVRFEFEHCRELQPTGRKVKKGEVIGFTGDTGKGISGPHVHINVFIGAQISEKGVITKKGFRVNPKYYTRNSDIYNAYAKDPVTPTLPATGVTESVKDVRIKELEGALKVAFEALKKVNLS